MSNQTLNKTIFPKGGYIFTDADRTTFRAASWDTLVEAVRLYRERNKLPAGNPLEEVTRQACRRDPNACRASDTKTSATSPQPSLRSRALIWLSRMRKAKQVDGNLRYVSDAEAARRAGVCRLCPRRVDVPASGCSACSEALTALRGTVLGRKPVPAYDSLGLCSVLAFDLAAGVCLDEAALTNSDLPPTCWRRVNEGS